MSTLNELIAVGVDNVKLVHKQFSAGGPGSGRKPEFKSDKNKDKLDSMHKTITNAGFKFKNSTSDSRESGLIRHTYENSKGDRARIFERANGNHASDRAYKGSDSHKGDLI